MKKIIINDITIRDIFQNVESKYINEKILSRVIEQLSKVRFDSIEVLGGSSFEKMLESSFSKTPFEIIYDIKNKNPNLKLQALIGAGNLVGMEIYPLDTIKKFLNECKNSGITSFRIFDALNDLENFKRIVPEIIDIGCDCQGTLIYDNLEDDNFYIKSSSKLLSYGCTSICIKDVESTLLPGKAARLFKDLSDNIKSNFFLSVYNLRGLQVANYYNACISGCSGLDLSFIPSSYNDLNPAVFPFLLSLKDTDLDTSIDYLKTLEVFEWFKKTIYPFIKNDLLHSRFIFSNKNQNLLPKWLLSSINNQLSEIGESNKIDMVCDEVFKIKNEIGNPSLSTPVGQIIGSQAILNTVISDYRYEITNDEIIKLILGYYGNLPRKIDTGIKKKIFHGDEIKSGNEFEESNETIFEQCKDEISDITEKNSDILSYMFFPEKTLKLLKTRKNGIDDSSNIEKIPQSEGSFFSDFIKDINPGSFEKVDMQKLRDIASLVETSNIDEINLELDGIKLSINKKQKGSTERTGSNIQDSQYKKEQNEKIPDSTGSINIFEVRSPIVGTFYSSPSPGSPPFVTIGSKIKKGDTLCIIEAMKLMNKINAEIDGTIEEILVKNEDPVDYDHLLIRIRK
jgi:oxaloacetate decarboxylase (Na+ extruding) subunit alpha